MSEDKQLIRLKELKQTKNKILKTIYEENINLLNDVSKIETLMINLQNIKNEQKQIWKERHQLKRQKYDQSERGRELSRLRAIKNYRKKQAAKAAEAAEAAKAVVH